MTKKDLKSFEAHNADYETKVGIESFRDTIKQYNIEEKFECSQFSKAISKIKDVNVHIDVGSGGGWLLFKTSPLFKKVYGIEPSKIACDNVSILIKEKGVSNIELINSDMIEGLEKINLQEPAFFTTAIVLSHIKNFYVKKFLKKLNGVPNGSAIYFCERYDRNIQQKLWYVRRKYWWAKNLNEWQLEFFGFEDNGYRGGIFALKVGKGGITNNFKPNIKEDVLWFFDGLKNKSLRLSRFCHRIIKKCLKKS
ncbi:MAG: class I SAM-dependent methyltransferase [bacterium]|nr:class I SAM-dependent methyltransferase [bacterium]